MRIATRTRLGMGFLAVAGIPLLAAGLGFQSASTTKQALETVVEQQLERALAAGRLEAAQLNMSRKQKDLVMARRAEAIEPAVSALQQARLRVRRAVDAFDAFSSGVKNPQLVIYRAELDAYEKILDQIVPLIRARSGGYAAELAAETCKPAYLSLDDAISKLIAELTAAADTEDAGHRGALLEAIRQVAWLRAAVAEAHVHTRDYLLAQDSDESGAIMSNVTMLLARFDQRGTALRRSIPSAFRNQLAEVERRFETWFPIIEKIVGIAARQTEIRAVELSVGPGGDRMIAMSEAVADMVASAQQASELARSAANSAYDDARSWALAALLVAVAVALVAGLWVSASLMHQIGLEQFTNTLAHEVETRRAAEEAALAASKAKGEFLAMMSHEVRTPLNGILGSAHLLAASELSEEQLDNARTIEGCGRSLLTVLDDILDYSKIEAGKMSVETIPFDLEATVRRTVKLQRANAEAKGLALNLRFDSTALPSYVSGDPSRLSQVLNNLIGNAVKFTDAGGVDVSVETRGPMLRFQVDDTGIGIEPEALDGLFRPFEQADSRIARRFGGTGLGLSISHRLVELMGGAIGVESEFGHGSRFWFEIQCVEATVPCRPSPVDADLALPKRVLVVDDNEVNRRVAERMLIRHGVEVVVAESGEAALGRLKEESVDLVLMDVQMPGMDGLEATRRIRSDPRHCRLTVIGLSANVLAHHREAGLGSGMDGYLTKPFTVEDVSRSWSARALFDHQRS